jgi:hypothetical protein
LVHFLEQVDGGVQHEVVAEHQIAEPRPRHLNGSGGRDFVGTREHRYLTHLHEVHADGIVDVRFGAAVFRQVLELVVLDFYRLVEMRVVVDEEVGVIMVMMILRIRRSGAPFLATPFLVAETLAAVPFLALPTFAPPCLPFLATRGDADFPLN